MSNTGSGEWDFGGLRSNNHSVLFTLRRATRFTDGFPSPHDLAEIAKMRVVDVTALPGTALQLTDGRSIWCAWHDDQRERGVRVFRALAVAILGCQRTARTEEETFLLAARLAAPPLLMHRVGIDETIRRQPWATEFLLRWWWAQRHG